MDAPEPSAPADFTLAAWAHLRDILAMVVNLFGLPAALAAQRFLTRKTRSDMLIWLRAAETLVRRVLLIEASRLPRPNRLPEDKRRKGIGGVHGRAGHASENPEDWSVSFKAVPPARRKRASALRKTQPVHQIDARPLAERLEALFRVIENPEAYAQRLARRLYAKPQRAMRIVSQDGLAKINPLRTVLAEAQPLAYAAARAFRDSS